MMISDRRSFWECARYGFTCQPDAYVAIHTMTATCLFVKQLSQTEVVPLALIPPAVRRQLIIEPPKFFTNSSAIFRNNPKQILFKQLLWHID